MLLDITPYKFWRKKLNLAAMSDGQVDAELKRSTFVLDNLHGYASQVAHAAFFTFPIVGWTCVALSGAMAVSGAALLGTIAATYAVYKGGGMLLCAGVKRAVRDKNDLEAEQQVREIRRVVREKQTAIEEAERAIKAIRDRALKAKEDFNAAINAGLPLEKAIQVRKSPLTLKTSSRGNFFRLGV